MRQTRRRWLVTAAGAGATALSGCSVFSSDSGEDGPDVNVAAVERALREREGPTIPATNPLSVPDSAIERHRERARETLADVPSDLSVPNGAVTRELRADRERVAENLDASADGTALDRLSTWQNRRGAAVNVARAYAAAIGDADRETYRERRRESLEDLALFESSIEYRATDPVTAAVGFVTLESWLKVARNRLEPSTPFPAEPRSAVFEIGDRWEAIEQARAETADARRLRDASLAVPEATSQRSRLASAAQRLAYSYRASSQRVDQYLNAEVSVLDADTEAIPVRELFQQAAGGAEWRGERAAEARDRHDHAMAVVEAGRALVAVETLDRVATEIESGEYRPEVSETTVTDAHESAVAAVEDAVATTPRPLAVTLVEPAAGALDGVRRRIEGTGFSPERVQATLDYATRYARVVPAATTFVAERLAAED